MNYDKEMLNMKNQMKKITSGLLVTGLLVTGLTTGATAYAASSNTGSAGANSNSKYSLEDMLTYAIEDEYLAQAEYDVIMENYGDLRPFSNIIKAEATHISELILILEEYDVEIPEKDWENLVSVPDSLEASYEAGVEAEENNIKMYENFLNENLPDDVKDVFESLMSASEKHLSAFQRQVDGIGCDSDSCSGIGEGGQRGKCNSAVGGNGQGNRSYSQSTQ